MEVWKQVCGGLGTVWTEESVVLVRHPGVQQHWASVCALVWGRWREVQWECGTGERDQNSPVCPERERERQQASAGQVTSCLASFSSLYSFSFISADPLFLLVLFVLSLSLPPLPFSHPPLSGISSLLLPFASSSSSSSSLLLTSPTSIFHCSALKRFLSSFHYSLHPIIAPFLLVALSPFSLLSLS